MTTDTDDPLSGLTAAQLRQLVEPGLAEAVLAVAAAIRDASDMHRRLTLAQMTNAEVGRFRKMRRDDRATE